MSVSYIMICIRSMRATSKRSPICTIEEGGACVIYTSQLTCSKWNIYDYLQHLIKVTQEPSPKALQVLCIGCKIATSNSFILNDKYNITVRIFGAKLLWLLLTAGCVKLQLLASSRRVGYNGERVPVAVLTPVLIWFIVIMLKPTT